MLNETLPNTDVAVCGLPTWNSDFFEPFLGYLDRHNLEPERIVWIADSASLLELASQEKRLEAARAILEDDAGHDKITRQWQSRIAEGQPPYLITVDDHNQTRDQFRAKLDALDITAVLNTLAEVTVPNVALVEKALSSARLNARNERNFSGFCSQIRRRGIRLDIVMSPFQERVFQEVEESLGAERMGELIATADKVRAFVDCSTTETELSLADWGLDERHFINRSAQDDYDYSIWSSAEAFNTALEDMPDRAQLRIIDSDHLNPIGAEIFTRVLVEKLDIAADQQ